MDIRLNQDWTPEQLENAMRYGVCLKCGTPRETRMTDTVEAGKRVVTHGIIYPCGHTDADQDEALEDDPQLRAYLRSIHPTR